MVDFNLPRADFKTCIEFIYEDLQAAEDYLPLDYNDLDIVGGTGIIPQKYKDVGITSLNAYNRVMGAIFRQRMCGRIVEAIRAKVALFAASPAYLNGTDNSWAKAAEYAAVVLNRINGPAGLAPKGLTWYTDNASTAAGINPPEIIWRHRTRNLDKNSAPEVQLYPPTLYGNGWINPSQNLVDAFRRQMVIQLLKVPLMIAITLTITVTHALVCILWYIIVNSARHPLLALI